MHSGCLIEKFRHGHLEIFRSRLWASFLYNATLYANTTAAAAATATAAAAAADAATTVAAAATATADTTNRSFIALFCCGSTALYKRLKIAKKGLRTN